jgi:hypothetical protein
MFSLRTLLWFFSLTETDSPLSRYLEDAIVNTLPKGSIATEMLPTKCVVG